MGAEEKNEKTEEAGRRKEKIKKDKEEKREDGADGILHEAGKILGFDGILKKIEKLPHFKKRLKEVDEEIEQRLKEYPLKMTHGGPGRVNSMPPGIKGTPLTGKRAGVRRPAASGVSADVFDENDHLLVVADLPGVPEDTIDISLDGDVLALSFIREGSGIKKGVKLPCAPEGEIVKTYKNGVLEVKIKKNKT
ncbi:MAG: Hsp20/alpha crystallin family protein [Deltaproteobacteria bacterium]|nr:Hsp20/alpha crystallin family protein [Deltaproteobacteria bacterium]